MVHNFVRNLLKILGVRQRSDSSTSEISLDIESARKKCSVLDLSQLVQQLTGVPVYIPVDSSAGTNSHNDLGNQTSVKPDHSEISSSRW